jgi:uncharacterized membrane protein YsdA (DUF1294 family)
MRHVLTFFLWVAASFVFFLLTQSEETSHMYRYPIAGYLACANLIGLLAMLSDKRRARSGSRRIPEKILFRIAAIGGGIGTLVGMRMFRHKTKHLSFVILIPFMTLVQYVLFFI